MNFCDNVTKVKYVIKKVFIMTNLTFDEFNSLEFNLYENNPIIKNPHNSFVVADPSVLTPDNSHDGKWHLFAHTFFGIYHYVSENGTDYRKKAKVVPRAMRPDINYIDGTYYLFYERTKNIIGNALTVVGGKWKSEIYLTMSEDLVKWSEPELVIGKTRSFEEDKNGQSISNPFLLETDCGYRLYYSCGQTFIDDCGFCEPTHISFAESRNIDRGYVSREKPIISPDKEKEYVNLCSGCLKVYRLADCYIGLQNGIYRKDGKSHSAIMLLKSDNGVDFDFVRPFLVPQVCGDNKWMAQFVYASHLVRHGNRFMLYFNARNTADMLTGREAIGIYEAELK